MASWRTRYAGLAPYLGLFLALFGIYMANGARFLGGDTLGSPYTALSLMRDGDFYIDSHVRGYPANAYWFWKTPGGTVSILGFGTPLMALPIYQLFDVLVWDGRWTENRLLVVGKVAGAVMTALAAVLIALVARRFVSRAGAFALALAFGLCSSAWSISSQALWKHSPAGLLVAAGLALLIWPAEESPSPVMLRLSAVPLAFAGWCRENLALVAVAAAVYLAVTRGRRNFLWFAGLAALVGGGLLALNAVHFGSPAQGAQRLYAEVAAAREGVGQWDTPLWLGIYGLFFSPSRGLFVYSPVFLASVLGLWLGRRDPDRATWIFLAVGALLALGPGLKWHWWWGGDNYGPRMTVDAMPLLTLLLVPAWRALVSRRALAGALAALALFSCLVQAVGAIKFDGVSWDERSPAESINLHPERLLRWHDSQLMYYLGWPDTRPDRIPWR